MEYKRYKGTVAQKTSKDKSVYFIDRRTIVDLDTGEPVNLDTEADIFLHVSKIDNFAEQIAGSTVVFSIAKDTTRKESLRPLRALGAHGITVMPYEEGCTLSVITSPDEHPSVEIEWRLSDQAIREISFDPQMVALMIVAQQSPMQKGDDPYYWDRNLTEVKIVRDVKRLAQGRELIPFSAPGTYDIAAFLMQRTNTRTDATSDYNDSLHRARHHTEEARVWSDSIFRILSPTPVFGFARTDDQIVAVMHTKTVVAEGIFAEPPPKILVAYLNYFEIYKWRDTCALLRWLIVLIPFGWIGYCLAEGFKRGRYLIWGLGDFLIGKNPLVAWGKAFATEWVVYWNDYDTPYFIPCDKRGRPTVKGSLLRPIVVIVGTLAVGGCLFGLYSLCRALGSFATDIVAKHDPFATKLASLEITAIAVIGTIAVLIALRKKWKAGESDRAEQKAKMQKKRDSLLLQSSASVSKALASPESPKPISTPSAMVQAFSWIRRQKRGVCRPYNVRADRK